MKYWQNIANNEEQRVYYYCYSIDTNGGFIKFNAGYPEFIRINSTSMIPIVKIA